MMIRSAKMNEITPPKLMPPFQRTAASGTFPIEHTKLRDRDDRPDQGSPDLGERRGGRSGTVGCQNESGTQAATAPAISSPITMSRSTAAHSITKMCATEVNPPG